MLSKTGLLYTESENMEVRVLKIEENENAKIKIIPLGGLEQIGMNMTIFEYEDNIIVVDCGLSFPDDDMLGIDLVIPDITYLKENASKVKGFVITHGHEDHIGALPYVLKEVDAPIYATKLTLGIIEGKLKEHGLEKSVKKKVVKHGQSINLGCFRIEFIKVNHSIADAAGLAIFTPAGVIVHTGDFKIDYTQYMVIQPTLPDLVSWVKRVCLLLWQIVPMLLSQALQALKELLAGLLTIYLLKMQPEELLLQPLHLM